MKKITFWPQVPRAGDQDLPVCDSAGTQLPGRVQQPRQRPQRVRPARGEKTVPAFRGHAVVWSASWVLRSVAFAESGLWRRDCPIPPASAHFRSRACFLFVCLSHSRSSPGSRSGFWFISCELRLSCELRPHLVFALLLSTEGEGICQSTCPDQVLPTGLFSRKAKG